MHEYRSLPILKLRYDLTDFINALDKSGESSPCPPFSTPGTICYIQLTYRSSLKTWGVLAVWDVRVPY